jgi:restriction system protein
MKKSSLLFFERLVIDLLVGMGYGGSQGDAGKAVAGASDGGIEGIIKEDKPGLNTVYVQAKRWGNTMGRPVVEAFAGSLEGQPAGASSSRRPISQKTLSSMWSELKRRLV